MSNKRKIRKPRPSPPDWVWYSWLDDNCYGCKDKNNCSNCNRLQSIPKKQKKIEEHIYKDSLNEYQFDNLE
jgi:hypothetical protein